MLKDRELKVGDKWLFYNVTYTVECNEDGLYFKHPSELAGQDDHIEIEHVGLGYVTYKEGDSND